MLRLEREPSGDHPVEPHAEGEDIRPTVDGLASDLLGRHVENGAADMGGAGRAVRPDEFRETEVEDLDLFRALALVDHDVLQREIAVKHALAVGVRHPVTHLDPDLAHFLCAGASRRGRAPGARGR